MSILDRDLDLRAHDDGVRWTLLSEVRYVTRHGETIVVPVGSITDFASTRDLFGGLPPRLRRLCWILFWWVQALVAWLLPPMGPYSYAALIHDQLYAMRNRARAEADWIFLEAMVASRVPFWQIVPLYLGVRIGGGSRWGSRRRA